VAEPTLEALLAVAQEAAWVGGRRTLAYFNTGTANTEWKADATPVTMADKEAEKLMRGVIGRAFPEHSILGEEEGETKGSAPYRWILDPLDGTRTFVRGVPLYGTLIMGSVIPAVGWIVVYNDVRTDVQAVATTNKRTALRRVDLNASTGSIVLGVLVAIGAAALIAGAIAASA